MLTAALKHLTALSQWTLREALSRTGALGYVQPALRFVPHVPIHKHSVVRKKKDTWPIGMEEEIAKHVAIMIIAQTEQYVSDGQ